ncbi:MAG: hypothetical protein WCZ72_02385 [Gemmobacter sp.]
MNLNGMVNMILRMFMRRAVNKGIGMATRGLPRQTRTTVAGNAGDPPKTEAERKLERDARKTARTARQAARITRRLGRR